MGSVTGTVGRQHGGQLVSGLPEGPKKEQQRKQGASVLSFTYRSPVHRMPHPRKSGVCLLLVGAPALAGPIHGHPSPHPCTQVHVLVPELGDLVFSLSALVPKAGSLAESGAGPAAIRQSPPISTPTGFRYA